MNARTVGLCMAAAILTVTVVALAVPRSQVRGRPQMQIGREVGYFLWMDAAVLHVRWTTANPENHAFRGELTVESGDLGQPARVNLEVSDRTTLESPHRFAWNANEHLGLDGFDVTLPGPARLSLFIDNRPAEKTAIFLGGRRKNPTAAGVIDIAGR